MTTATKKIDAVTRAHITGPHDERAAKRGCYFDEKAAARVCKFFERFLKHSKGKHAGKAFTLLPWQRNDLLGPLFGWKRPDGTRRFRVGYVTMAKKNGKSTTCAGIDLFMLVGDGEAGAEVYAAAKDRKQSGIIYREAASMVKKSPALRARCTDIVSQKRITFEQTGSFFQALSGDAGSNEGVNTHALIVDELHEHRSRELWDTLRYSGDARDQPLILAITTAGWDRESICFEQYTYAKGVLNGTIEDDAFFALIYEAAAPEDAAKVDILDAEAHKRANPSYGVTVKADTLMAQAREALALPRKINNFKRRKLNIWTEAEARWLKIDLWDAAATAEARKNPMAWRVAALKALAGAECFGGLDLGSTSDLTALVLCFPGGLPGDGRPVIIPWFWAPSEGVWHRDMTYREVYRTWMREGWMIETPGNATDYDRVRADINKIADRYGLKILAIDRVFQGGQLGTQLMGDGLDVQKHGQGFYSMAAPAKRFEEMHLEKKLNHGANPILAWMAANVCVAEDPAGNIKPIKPKKNSPLKVDGIVCSVMALGAWGADPAHTASVWFAE